MNYTKSQNDVADSDSYGYKEDTFNANICWAHDTRIYEALEKIHVL